MSGSGCQVAAMIDLHTGSYVLWLGAGQEKTRERALITLFRGREVLPCVSFYMLELCSYKHSHVSKEWSLFLSFGPRISYCNRKSHQRNHLKMFVFHTKNYYWNKWFMSYRVFQCFAFFPPLYSQSDCVRFFPYFWQASINFSLIS